MEMSNNELGGREMRKGKNTTWIMVILLITLIASGSYLTKRLFKWNSIENKCWGYVNNGFYDRVIELDNSTIDGDKSPSTYACVGTAYYNLGNLELALKKFKKAEEMEDNILYSYKSPKLDFNIYTNIAKIFYEMKRYDKSIEYYNKALEKVSDRDDLGDILMKIAEIYEEIGDIDNAIKYYQDALVNHRCGIGERIRIYRKIAELYERKGDKANAERYSDMAFRIE